MNKFIIFVVFVSLLVFSGCMFITPKTYQNNDIDKDVRDEIAPLNKKLFKSIMTKDIKSVMSMISPLLIDSGKKIDTVVKSMANIFHASDYRVLDEYYTVHSSLSKPTELVANNSDFNYFTVTYQAINSETYTAILISKNLPVNCSVLAIYGKYNNGWKINVLQIGSYDILGKTAPEYYAMATDKIRKGDTIDAADMIIMASQIGTPGGKYIKYNNVDDMMNLYSSTIAEANATYHFPLAIRQIKTVPQIFSISPQLIEGTANKGYYPMIRYLSNIKLTDTVALKIENSAIQKMIGTLFKGITEDKSYILYQAYNQVPNGKTQVNRYGFAQKLN